MKHVLRAIVAVSAVAVMTLALTPSAALAAAYDGQMAASTSCANDVITGASRTVSTNTQLGTVLGEVQLRYSRTCRTVWARITSKVVDSNHLGGYVQRNSDGASYQCSEFGYSNNLAAFYCLTPMLNDANVTSYVRGAFQYQGQNYFGQTTNY